MEVGLIGKNPQVVSDAEVCDLLSLFWGCESSSWVVEIVPDENLRLWGNHALKKKG